MSRHSKKDLKKRWEQDSDSRRVAQTEFNVPVLLEAGAGTGKTAALTARVVVWCLEQGWEKNRDRLSKNRIAPLQDRRIAGETVDRVLAVTFTEAAAAEMSARVCKAFREISMGERPVGILEDFLETGRDEKRYRAGVLLSVQDRLKISTLHAFCRRLISEHPMEAGLHPMSDVDADGTVTGEIVRELLEERLSRAYEEGDPDLLKLAALSIGPGAIWEALSRLAKEAVSPSFLDENPFNEGHLKDIRGSLRDAIAAFKKSGGDNLNCTKNAILAVEMVRDIDAFLQEFDAFGDGAEPVEIIERLFDELKEMISGNGLKRLSEWANGKFSNKEAKRMRNISPDDIIAASSVLHSLLKRIPDMNPSALESARKTLKKLYHETVSILRKRGVLSFAGLIRHAVELLENNPFLCRRLSAGFDQVLVDEFQDTDKQQCRLLELLAMQPSMEQRPGLFLVGDPKQSIYGWRNAELEAYEKFKEKVKAAGGKIHALSKNFRSVPPILAEVDRLLEPVMKHEPGLQPVFQRLDPCPEKQDAPGFTAGSRSPVEYWVSWNSGSEKNIFNKTVASVAATLEAEAVARDIRQISETGVSYSDMGVLFRSTGDLEVYVAALRRHGIPYSVCKDRNYYKRREIIDAAALVRCIVDPNDHLPFLTLLRSPMVGVPDAALIPLWARGFPMLAVRAYGSDEAFSARVQEVVLGAKKAVSSDIPGIDRIKGWHHNLCAAMENLGLLREIFHTQPVDVFTESVRRLFLIEPVEACRYLGGYRVANLNRFFDELAGVLGRENSNVHALLRYLRVCVAEEQEAPEAAVPEATRDAVRLMTIHGAKGLDFLHVYLVQTHKNSRSETLPKNDVQEDDHGLDYTLFGFPTWNYERIMEKRKKIRSRELIRTLYVAATRAAERLVILGKWPVEKKKKPLDAKSYMDLLTQRACPPLPLVREFEELPEEILFDDEGVTWRFLKPEAPKVASRETQKKTKKLEYDSGKLIELMTESTARMSRPLSMRVTRAGMTLDHPDDVRSRLFSEQHNGTFGESTARSAALLTGTAVHSALETWNFRAPVSEELARRVLVARGFIQVKTSDPEVRDTAIQNTVSLLEEFSKGSLFEKLSGLSEHILARELEVLAPPRILEQYLELEGRSGGNPADSPLGYVTGTIDLVYKDPATGDTVIADYKTDNVTDPAEIESGTAIHASQMHLYGLILQEALDLSRMPRLELWFIRPQVIMAVR